MTTRTMAPDHNLILANIQGERDANQFLTNLSTFMLVGDDLYRAIAFHTNPVSDESAEWLRGFCRSIEKACERAL